MTPVWKKTVKRAVIGFLSGMVIGNVISFVSGGGMPASETIVTRMGGVVPAVIVQTLLEGLYGAIAMAGVTFHELETWNMLKAAVCHYLLIACTIIPMALFLGWIDASFVHIAVYATFLLAAYFIIWLIMYFRHKKEVRELNRLLKDEKDHTA